MYEEALDELVTRAKIEISKLAFGDDSEDAKSIPWSDIQFWVIMKKLADNGFVRTPLIAWSCRLYCL